MLLASVLAFLALLCVAFANNGNGNGNGNIFDPTMIYQALGTYGNGVNGLAKFSPVNCGDPAGDGLTAAAREFVYSIFSQRYLKYFRTAQGGVPQLNFEVGGVFDLGNGAPPVPLTNSTVLMDNLATFYWIIFSFVFSQPNHWLYSTPVVAFDFSNPAFGGAPTATVTVENESRAFVCSPEGRVFQVYFNTFQHVFCYENNPGHVGDGWKLCGFFEDNKGIFTQEAALFKQAFPVLAAK